MHTLFGLSWDEWGSIVAVVTFIAAVFKYVIFASFQDDIKKLNMNFAMLNHNLESLKIDIDRLDQRTNDHDRRLDRHHERLKNIDKEVFR